jgi:hypothetical protein
MNEMKQATLRILSVVLTSVAISIAAFGQPTPTDVITVGNASGAYVVNVPVSIRDVSATPLGIDQPAGSRIQSLSIRVTYSSPYVQSVAFVRDGITTPLTPEFEANPSAPGSSSLIAIFDEATNLIPFVSNAAAPGNLVAHLQVTFVPGTPAGTTVPLTIDPVLTQLADEGGTPATLETVANGRLTLVAGSVTFAGAETVPTLSEWALGLLAAAIAIIAVRARLS